jgi:hypothetical protein
MYFLFFFFFFVAPDGHQEDVGYTVLMSNFPADLATLRGLHQQKLDAYLAAQRTDGEPNSNVDPVNPYEIPPGRNCDL